MRARCTLSFYWKECTCVPGPGWWNEHVHLLLKQKDHDPSFLVLWESLEGSIWHFMLSTKVVEFINLLPEEKFMHGRCIKLLLPVLVLGDASLRQKPTNVPPIIFWSTAAPLMISARLKRGLVFPQEDIPIYTLLGRVMANLGCLFNWIWIS